MLLFKKKILVNSLLDVKDEYYNPQQEYILKNVMKEIYSVLEEKIYNFREEVLLLICIELMLLLREYI